MENNTILLIGASTENPFFSITAAMRSRSMLFELKSVDKCSLLKLCDDIVEKYSITIGHEAKEYLISSSGGDVRAMLKLLELVCEVTNSITIKDLKALRPTALNDGSSEASVHYDLISAMIKSIRGSDPDAAIYYLARLIAGGENPEFIARRLVILASEDVGNANPQALTLCTSAMTSVAKIGYPEARIILAQAVTYLCASPKSNSAYIAINSALSTINDGEILDIPKNILPNQSGYLYPHDFGGYVKQRYLEKNLKFVEFKEIGYEGKMKQWLEQIRD
jgi:putative ATPase